MSITTYAIAKDVENFLLLALPIDDNSPVTRGQVERYILQAEGEFHKRTGTAFKPILVEDEMHTVQPWRRSQPEFLDEAWIAARRGVKLMHRPLLPFDTTKGHKIEVYEGSETASSAADPIRRWTDWVADKTYGRDNDFYFDAEKGVVYVRKTFLFRRRNVFRFTYEYGKPITQLDGAISDTDDTITVDSTYGYQNRGVIRIGNEYVFHTGKTSTTFTGCIRGELNTTADSHGDNTEVFEIPDDVRTHVAMRAAALFLENEVFVSMAGDGAGSSPSFDNKVRGWNEQWNKWLTKDYQRFELLDD